MAPPMFPQPKNPMVLIILTFPSFLTQKEINGTHIRSTPSIVSARSQKIKRNLPETRQKGGGTAAKWRKT